MVKDEVMVSHVICGSCGTLLDRSWVTCPTCGARASAPALRSRKSKWAAAVLAALVPGLGHIYLGQYAKGALYLAGAGGLTFLGLDLDLTVIGAALGVPMEMGALGLWAHGIWSAYHTAKLMEEDPDAGDASLPHPGTPTRPASWGGPPSG